MDRSGGRANDFPAISAEPFRRGISGGPSPQPGRAYRSLLFSAPSAASRGEANLALIRILPAPHARQSFRDSYRGYLSLSLSTLLPQSLPCLPASTWTTRPPLSPTTASFARSLPANSSLVTFGSATTSVRTVVAIRRPELTPSSSSAGLPRASLVPEPQASFLRAQCASTCRPCPYPGLAALPRAGEFRFAPLRRTTTYLLPFYPMQVGGLVRCLSS